jgi:hypothetical protein
MKDEEHIANKLNLAQYLNWPSIDRSSLTKNEEEKKVNKRAVKWDGIADNEIPNLGQLMKKNNIPNPIYPYVNCQRVHKVDYAKPFRQREKESFKRVYNDLNIITPDFQEFASGIIHWQERSELIQTVKVIALMKGFKIIVPNGRKEKEKTVLLCHKTGFRYRVSSTKRTNCPFALIYNIPHLKKTYSLVSYRNNHNHPLSETDPFIGQHLLSTAHHIASLIKPRLSLPSVLSKLLHLTPITSRAHLSSLNFTSELSAINSGTLPPEDSSFLKPWTMWSLNIKVFQLDAFIRSLLLNTPAQGDISSVEEDPDDDVVHGVKLSIKGYRGQGHSDLRPRMKIIEYARELEKELMEEMYREGKDDGSVDGEGWEEVEIGLKMEGIEGGVEERMALERLGVVGEKVSVYRIYEVPEDWDEGDPLKLLEMVFPIYRVGEKEVEDIEEIEDIEEDEKKEELEEDDDKNKENSSESEKISESSEKLQNDTQSDMEDISKECKDYSDDILEEINADIDGIEANSVLMDENAESKIAEILSSIEQPQENLKRSSKLPPNEI